MRFYQFSRKLFPSLLLSLLCINMLNAQQTELFHRVYSSKDELKAPTLVLVLHGDSPSRNPSYQYAIARRIANENSNVVAVGILRPGYTDEEGNRSAGERGETTGDNYTRTVLKAVHQLRMSLQEKYTPSKTLIVGHSGGAAISANLMAEYPNGYSSAVLISCPCDLHPWRKHMKALRPNSNIWDKEVDSLSPIEEVNRINSDAQIMIIHGDQDDTVPIKLAEHYFDALKAQNLGVKFIQLENRGHDVAFNPKVFEAIKGLID